MGKPITIIGDGAMGTICAGLLAEGGHSVRLWSAFEAQAADLRARRENRKFLPGVPIADSIEIISGTEGVFGDASLAVSAVPTQFVRAVWTQLAEAYPAGLAICSVAKGIENDTRLRPTEILRDVLGDRCGPVAVLSGPSIAPEIARGLPATVVAASGDDSLSREIQTLFSRPAFRVYRNSDLVGVELAGATKNVIAIAAGCLDGLDLGDNAKAALLSRGLAEISRLGLAAGASGETFYGLAGVGDLVTTCTSPSGRNRSFGEAIGRGQSTAEALGATESVVEGVATTRSVLELAETLGVEMPITQAVADVVFRDKDPREAILELMGRPLRAEVE